MEMEKKNIVLIAVSLIVVVLCVGGFLTYKKYFLDKAKISGEIIWIDSNNNEGARPKSVKLDIYNKSTDEIVRSINVNKIDRWKYNIENLPKYKGFKRIEYYVKENRISDYNISYKGYNITNTYSPEKISVNGTVIWNDENNKLNFRPNELKIELYNNISEEAISSVTTNESINWNYSFSDLEKYKDGTRLSYSIKVNNIEHYETSIDNYNIINDVIVSNPTTGNFKLILSFVIGTMSLISIIYFSFRVIKN